MLADKDGVRALPKAPGVYIFKDRSGSVIYVGKAKNLLSRVRSYFSNNLEPKTAKMVASSYTIEHILVESEFQALLLEAKLVERFKPKYNIQLRDDKSPLYIGITKEELPRVVLLRQREIDKINLTRVFGPFINSAAPRQVLRLIRRAIPFSTHKPGRRPCVYSEIGLCSPCPSEVKGAKEIAAMKRLRAEYLLNVRRVMAVLSGRSKAVAKEIEKEMKLAAKKEDFEGAREARKKLEALYYTINRVELDEGYLENPNLLEDIRAEELASLRAIIDRFYKIKRLKRIECFDVAHLAGAYPTASMVTFINGEPDKSYYRHFRLHHKNSDVDNMREVLERRYKRLDWGTADLIVVDGGKPQISVAVEVISKVPVVGLAKREETFVFKTESGFYEYKIPEGPAKKLVQRIRNEAHRFARSYHHKLVSRAIRKVK